MSLKDNVSSNHKFFTQCYLLKKKLCLINAEWLTKPAASKNLKKEANVIKSF